MQSRPAHKPQSARESSLRHGLRTDAVIPPVSNYTLSTVCPACVAPTYRRACKVRCARCGFMWDCSEL